MDTREEELEGTVSWINEIPRTRFWCFKKRPFICRHKWKQLRENSFVKKMVNIKDYKEQINDYILITNLMH